MRLSLLNQCRTHSAANYSHGSATWRLIYIHCSTSEPHSHGVSASVNLLIHSSRFSVRVAVSLIYRVYVSNRQTNLHYGEATQLGFPLKNHQISNQAFQPEMLHTDKTWLLFLIRLQQYATYEVWSFTGEKDVPGIFPFCDTAVGKESHSHNQIQLQVVGKHKRTSSIFTCFEHCR